MDVFAAFSGVGLGIPVIDDSVTVFVTVVVLEQSVYGLKGEGTKVLTPAVTVTVTLLTLASGCWVIVTVFSSRTTFGA